MDNKKAKVTAYITNELNARMWTHINQESSGSSTYGAVSNFVTNAVTSYLADSYTEPYIPDRIMKIFQKEEDEKDV